MFWVILWMILMVVWLVVAILGFWLFGAIGGPNVVVFR